MELFANPSAWRPPIGSALWKLATKVRWHVRSPETMEAAAAEVFAIAMVCSWILTYAFNPQVLESNPLKDVVGYNNLCVGWDEAPAVYVATPLYTLMMFFYIRYVNLNFIRMHLTKNRTRSQWIFSYVANIVTSLGFCSSFLLFVIGPRQSALWHSVPFLQLQVAMYLSCLALFYEADPKYYPWGSGLFCIFYGVCVFGFAACALVQLVTYDAATGTRGPVPWWLCALFDRGWFLCLPASTLFKPVAPSIGFVFRIVDQSDGVSHMAVLPAHSSTGRDVFSSNCPWQGPAVWRLFADYVKELRCPEQLACAGGEVLVLLLIASGLLNYAVNAEVPLLTEVVGYRSLWADISSAPSLYMVGPLQGLVAFLFIRAFNIETLRMNLTPDLSACRYWIAYILNSIAGLSFVAFSLNFVYRSGKDSYAHYYVIFQVQIATFLAYIGNFFANERRTRPTGSCIFLVLFAACSVLCPLFMSVQLLRYDSATEKRGPVPWWLCMIFDYGWIICVVIKVRFEPKAPSIGITHSLVEDDDFKFGPCGHPPRLHQVTPEDVEFKLSARRFAMLASSLYLPLSVVSFLSTLGSLLVSTAKRLFAVVCRPHPNASPAKRKEAAAEPVPGKDYFIGDIAGYAAFMSRELAAVHEAAMKAGGGVVAMNVGCPVVGCLDVASTEAMLRDMDVARKEYSFLSRWSSGIFEGQKPNFWQQGEMAVKVRRLIQALLPEDEEDSRFKEAFEALRGTLRLWAEVPDEDLKEMDLEEAVLEAIVAFTTTLFLGQTLDPELVRFAMLVAPPVMGPVTPKVPMCLHPQYWRSRRAVQLIRRQIKKSPSGPRILEVAEQVGLEEGPACAALLIAMTFNAWGFCSSLLNAFIVVPHVPDLAKDAGLVDSVAWELLRHNGPHVITKTDKDEVLPTSKGKCHLVKQGTKLFTHLAYAQRDPTVYRDPHAFKPDRFKPLPSRALGRPEGAAEPLPVLGFACLLGSIDDAERRSSTHQCPFVHLAQPLVRRWVLMLAEEFQWTCEETSLRPAAAMQGSLDFSVGLLTGNGATMQMTPKPKFRRGLRFTSFRARDEGRTQAWEG